MANGLIEIVELRLPDLVLKNSHSVPVLDPTLKQQHRWVKIYDMREEPGSGAVGQQKVPELEVHGTKSNPRYERRLDLGFSKSNAAVMIQRDVRLGERCNHWGRMWIGKNRASERRRDRAARRIQAAFRRRRGIRARNSGVQ